MKGALARLARLAWVDPVAKKELYGISRRWSTYTGRSLALVAAGLIVWSFGQSELRHGGKMSYSEYADLSRMLFGMFGFFQLILGALAGVLQGSDMIAKEVRSQTLGVLALTPLGPFELVWGKWKACLTSVGMILLAWVPILGILVYLGGGSGESLLAVEALVISSAAATCALALAASGYFRYGYGAVVFSLLVLVGYTMGTSFLMWVVLRGGGPGLPSSFGLALHPLFAMMGLFEVRGGMYLSSAWVGSSLLMMTGSAAFLAIASARLAKISKRAPGPGGVALALGKAFGERAPGSVWPNHPFVWKELHSRAAGKLRGMVWITLGLVVLVLILGSVFSWNLQIALFLMMLVLVLVSIGGGASSFAREREERKWDILLTAPISGRALVLGKLVGACLAPAPVAIVMLLFLAFRYLVEGTPGGLADLYEALFSFSFFLVVAGMWISIRCKNTRNAYGAALALALLVLAGLPSTVAIYAAAVGLRSGFGSPVIAATNPFYYLESLDSQTSPWYVNGLVPLALYLSAALALLVDLAARFRAITLQK